MIDLALIGCGMLGRVHAACIGSIPEARFSAFMDVSGEAAERALADLGGDYATTDLERVLGDERVRAVYICTHHDSHAPLAIAAARAGKHIFIEKPLALSAAECEAVEVAVAEAGVHLMPAFKMRFYSLIVKAHQFIPHPQVVVGQMMDSPWPDDKWAQDPILGGGNVHSQGCHTTDILRYLAAGEPKRVWAGGGTMTHPGHPCIDQCAASIQFDNGCAAAWIQGDAGCGEFTSKFFFEVFGGGRAVQLHDRLKKATFTEGSEVWVEERPEEEGFQLENREFVDALLEDRAPVLSAWDGVQATRIVLAAERAIRTGEVQLFPPYKGGIEGELFPPCQGGTEGG